MTMVFDISPSKPFFRRKTDGPFERGATVFATAESMNLIQICQISLVGKTFFLTGVLRTVKDEILWKDGQLFHAMAIDIE